MFIASSSPPSTSSNPQVLGFALTLLHRSGSASSKSGQHLKGSLALLCVLPAHQTHGIGSSLHQTALSHLTDRVARSLTLSTPPALSSQLQLGSIFPRIFPGVPEGPEFDRAREWFERRGWSFKEGVSIDLYRTLVPGKEPEGLRELMGPAERRGLTFGPPGEGDVEGLMELQKAEFDDFTVSEWDTPPPFFTIALEVSRRLISRVASRAGPTCFLPWSTAATATISSALTTRRGRLWARPLRRWGRSARAWMIWGQCMRVWHGPAPWVRIRVFRPLSARTIIPPHLSFPLSPFPLSPSPLDRRVLFLRPDDVLPN